jgi:hypothetical protein
MLLCYDYQNGITNEEEVIIFVTKPTLFSIGTISLFETIQYVKTTNVEIMDTNVKTTILEQEFEVQSIENKIVGNKYEPKVALEDKVYPDTYYSPQPRSFVVDENLGKIKVQKLEIVGWMLTKDQQLMKLNLGIDAKPHMVKINA